MWYNFCIKGQEKYKIHYIFQLFLKSKLKSIFFKPKPVFSLILLGFFVFLPTNFAKAETFASDGVVFKTGLEVGGKPDNLVRVVKGSPINFSSVITVTSLKTQSGSAAQRIVIGTDRFDTATEGYFSAVTIRNVGLGVEIIGDLGNTCSNLAVSNLIGNSTKFVKCDFPGGKKDIAGSQVLVGQAYKMDFSVSASSYQALKLDQSKVGVAQKIAVYPYLDLDVIDIRMRDINLTITDAYQTVYVVYYNTQAELDAAVQRGDRAGAGNYGESTGSTKVDGSGNGIVGLINKILAAILGIVQEFIFLVFFYLIAPLIQAMLSVRVYTDEFAAVIYPGWEVVRNLSNIIFIVALIAIAIGTLLRIESYQFRPMLIQLILAALMVNFSLVIAQAILGVADTIQNQFLPNNVEVIRALAKDLMVSYRSSFLNDSVADTGYFAVTVKQLFYVALSIGSFLVFLAICVFLVVRIVMLWILLMLSPLAYAAGVLPATAGVRSEWWGTFLKYAFFTPIMAFFLNMTAVISNAQQNNPVLKRILSDSTSLGGDSNFAGFVVSVSSNILLLVFLIVALMVAEKAGIYGADAVTKIAKGGMLAPFALAAKGLKAGGERGFEAFQDKVNMNLDPRVWAHEWEEYSKKQKQNRAIAREGRQIKGVPTGSPRDMLEAYANLKGLKRVWQSRFGLNGFKKNIAKANEFSDKEKMLTDDEIKNKQIAIADAGKSIANFKTAEGDLKNNKISAIRAKQMALAIDQRQKDLDAKRKKLEDTKRNLVAQGLPTTDIDKQLKELKDLDDGLEKDVDVIYDQLNSGATTIDIDAVLNGRDAAHATEIKNGIFDKEEELSNIQSQVKNFEVQRERANGELIKDAELKTEYFNDRNHAWTPANKADAVKKHKEFKKFAEQVERPEAYYARAARLAREDDEGKKISNIHDEEELNKLLRNAAYQKDIPKAVAILKKLTRDRNLNEATEDWGYDTSRGGVQHFLERILSTELGIDHNEMMEISSEISYEAEGSKQYNASRLTTMDKKTGHLTWRDPKEHDMVAAIEINKSEPRKRFGDLPRWNYVVEGVDSYGNRTTEGWTGFGKEILLDVVGNEEAIRNLRSQGNTSAFAAIMKIPTWKEDLMNRGFSQGKRQSDIQLLIDSIEVAGGKARGVKFSSK